MTGKLTQNMQESVLTLICMDDMHGSLAANIVDVELFEPPYDDIAERAIRYRKKFGKAPGLAHIDDLFDHILSDGKNKRQGLYRQVLTGIVEQASGLNSEYILSRVNDFMQAQNLKASVLEAAERYQRPDESLVTDVRNILSNAIKFKPESGDAGTFLNDRPRVIDFMTTKIGADYALGIPELDRRGLGPTCGEALGLMAPKKRGKSWFCTHVGVMCLLQNARVLHISLEMDEQRVVPRYMQRLFAIAKRAESYKVPILIKDELDRVIGFKQKKLKPKISYEDTDFVEKVGYQIDKFGSRLSRLVVKNFPTGRLTIGMLEAYMDGLEITHGFIPDVLIVDYPKLMKLDRRQDLRIGLGLMMEELRGLCAARNVAGIFPLQTNRSGEGAKLITGEHTGEDYSLGQTLDILLTYNQTRAEKALGLARLHVDAARNDADGFSVLITQDYSTGQFVKQSSYVYDEYWKDIKGNEEDDSE